MPNIYDLDTPALLVDGDILSRNLIGMAELAESHGKKLRPHAKTHKCVEIGQMQVAEGAVGLTVAKISEAEVFANAGIDDLFIAHEVVGKPKVTRLIELARRATVRVGVDSREVAEPIAYAAKNAGLTLGVMLEADTGLGRAGARSAEEALELARMVSEMDGLELRGVFSHEGHLYRAKDQAERQRWAAQAAEDLRQLAGAMENQGTPLEEISVGSTPGAPLLAPEPGPTELRPGTYVFKDRTQVNRGANPDDCALTVLVTVTSVRADGKIITDAGSKSFAGDGPMPDGTFGAVLGYPELRFIAMSEEHGQLQSDPAQNGGNPLLRVGDKVRIVPVHVCTCVNMHDELIVFRGETVEERWAVAARGKIR